MNRLVTRLGLGILLAGCTAGIAPSQQPPQSPAPVRSPSSAPTPTLSRFPIAWPEGIVAFPVESSRSPLPYLEYLPSSYGDGTPRPLLVFLHGVDEEADGSEASLRSILSLGIPQLIADGSWPPERPFVVLMPQEPAAKSQRCDFGPEIDRFLEFAVDRYDIDAERIYLTGISCGAIGIWDYLAETDDNAVAAAVPISGHPAWATEEAGCAVARVAIWVFHGAQDDVVPVGFLEDSIDDLRSCTDPPPNDLELTTYPDADHDAWTRTYDLSAGHDVYAWLLQHEAN